MTHVEIKELFKQGVDILFVCIKITYK